MPPELPGSISSLSAYGEIIKVVHKDSANIRRQPVVRDDIDQKATIHQRREAFNQKPLFMSGASSTLVDHREIRWVEEQQVERFMADAAVKEAAEAHTMQSCLRLFRPAFIQLHTVGIAVVSLGQLPQSLSAAAAWVQQVRGHTLREFYSTQDQRDIAGVCRIIAQLDIVHQSADYRSIGFLPHREGCANWLSASYTGL